MTQNPDVLLDPSLTPAPAPAPTPAPAPAPAPTPGAQTPPENLLAAVKEEREKNRELTEKLRLAEEALLLGAVPNDDFSDEGKLLIERHVKPLADALNKLSDNLTVKDVIAKHPALAERQAEFEEYRQARPGYSADDAATLFLTEQGLVTPPVRRQGLEEPRGGDRTPAPAGMSSANADKLRLTNYKEWLRLLRAGQLPLSGNN